MSIHVSLEQKKKKKKKKNRKKKEKYISFVIDKVCHQRIQLSVILMLLEAYFRNTRNNLIRSLNQMILQLHNILNTFNIQTIIQLIRSA